MIRKITDDAGGLLAIVVEEGFAKKDTNFVTPEDLPQQVGFLWREGGDSIEGHFHKDIKRDIKITQETLIILEGDVEVDLYDSSSTLVTTVRLKKGDLIVLVKGGHSFEFLSETKMVEVKQGPYLGENDKVSFSNSS